MHIVTLLIVLVVGVAIGFGVTKTTSVDTEPTLDTAPVPSEAVGESEEVKETNPTNPAAIVEKAQQVVSTVEGVQDLSNRDLTQVPASVFSKTRTTVLDLSHNNLSGALQAEVRHLSQLRELNLSHNNFTGVPAEVGQLTQLEVLDLSHNPITGLPYEIGNLSNLKVLNLEGTNYAQQDLDVIKQSLPPTVEIRL